MSKRVEDKYYVSIEKPGKCEYCGKVAELRPYGKNGANICYKCGMKNRDKTDEMFEKRIKGVKTVIVGDPDTFN